MTGTITAVGTAWDAIRMPRCLGLAATEHLGRSMGSVIVEPGERRMYVLIPVGAAAEWEFPDTRALGKDCYLPVPPLTRTEPPGPYWLTPHDSPRRHHRPRTVDREAHLRLRLPPTTGADDQVTRKYPMDSTTTNRSARWLVSREFLPDGPRESWKRGSPALFRIGRLFDVLQLPAHLIDGRVSVLDTVSVQGVFSGAGIKHGVIVSRSRRWYYVLTPIGTGNTWGEPGIECLHTYHPSPFLSVPHPARISPPGRVLASARARERGSALRSRRGTGPGRQRNTHMIRRPPASWPHPHA